MAQLIELVHLDAFDQHGTAIIASDETVWITLCLHWWGFATVLWWFFAPAEHKVWMTLTLKDGRKVRTRAIRVAKRHVRIGTAPRMT